jgi:Holliday junction resolvasome RuvABC endonuclease subunit
MAAARSIGFRCTGAQLYFVVLDGDLDEPTVVAAHVLKAPVGADRPSTLDWLHKEVHELLDKYEPTSGYFKATEPISKTKDLERGQFEGVLMQSAFSHKSHLSITSRVKNQIKHATAFERPARYLQDLAANAPARINAKSPQQWDAFLAALCGLPHTASNG